MTTKHTHPTIFGRKVADCPRCVELQNGAPAIKWSSTMRREQEQRRIADIRAHNCKVSGCGPVCTAFDW